MPRKKKEEAPEKVVFKREKILADINELYPLHPGQLILHSRVFDQKKKRIFAQCGRNWGKSVWIGRSTVEFACLNPNSHCFIICPNKVQAKEIYWDSALLVSMIPRYLLNVNFLGKEEKIKTELRIRLNNGSFIKLLGADDPDALRGLKPHFCAYDEYRDFKEGVYWSMEANLLGKNATLLIGSTPPDVVGHYSELRGHFISESGLDDTTYSYLELPTETNPHIDKKMLEDTKRRLVAHGQMRVWEREYMAKFIPGGASSIFPMFAENKEEIVTPEYVIEEIVKNDGWSLDFYSAADPATSSVFAVLFAAINKYTCQFIILDELYERDRMKTGSVDMWRRSRAVRAKWCKKVERWDNCYDEHESYFSRDLERYDEIERGENLEPTSKQSRNKEEDLGIIKDLMLAKGRLMISEECVNLIEEIESAATDKNGKIIKKKDHLIDDWRYIIALSGYTMVEQPNYEEYLEKKEKSKARVEGFDMFIDRRKKEQDWTSDLDESGVLTDDVIFLEDMGYGELF